MKIIKARKIQEIDELKALDTNENLFNEELDDPRRHFEMLGIALPILRALNPVSILTLGDTYGRDAYLYKKELGCRVIASDLNTDKLSFAKNLGYIDDFMELDAENMNLDSDSVDIIVAKETLHHWPQPMKGVYEALRVARMGVILIEPNDAQHSHSFPYPQHRQYYDHYEAVGNFVYRISVRELLKAAWALYYDRVFVKGFNDPWSPDIPFDKWLSEKMNLDEMGEAGIRQFDLMMVYIEKKPSTFTQEIQSKLNSFYHIYVRPENIHLKNSI